MQTSFVESNKMLIEIWINVNTDLPNTDGGFRMWMCPYYMWYNKVRDSDIWDM